MTPRSAPHVSRRLPFGLAAATATFAVTALVVALFAERQTEYLKVVKEIFIITITSGEPVLICHTQSQP